MIGLPGNPVSALVCAHLFVRPAVERLLGRRIEETATETARLARPLPANDRRQDFLRARLTATSDGTLEAHPFEKQDSSMLSLFAEADCLVVRPPFAEAAPSGTRVPIIRLD